MTESEPSADASVLAYATPTARGGRPVLGAIVAILAGVAGLFGALVLFYGIPGILYVVFDSNSRNFAGVLFELVMFLLIGCFCLYIAIRWFRRVPKIISGR